MSRLTTLGFCLLLVTNLVVAQSIGSRVLSGVVMSAENELVPHVNIIAKSADGQMSAVSDAQGAFRLTIPEGAFSGSLRYRHTGNYRLDPLDAGLQASGLDVVDLGISKRIRRSVDFNFAIDNLFNKRYFETQNFFESRLRPNDEAINASMQQLDTR
ncbi:MAG: TonB-dependent receptor [Acidobacteriota bacterium]